MKKLFGIFALCATMVIGAQANSTSGMYIGIGGSPTKDSSDKLFGMDSKDLIGEGGTFYDVQVGLYVPATSNTMGARAYVTAWHNPDKNKETGLGVGGQTEWRAIDSLNLNMYVGGQVGLGIQNNKGDKKQVKNAQSGIGHIIGDPGKDATVTFDSNGYAFEFAVTAGLNIPLTDHLSADIGYVGRYRHYHTKYHVNDSSWKTNVNHGAWENSARFALNYKF